MLSLLLLACAHPTPPASADAAAADAAEAAVPLLPPGLDPDFFRPRTEALLAALEAGERQPLPIPDELVEEVGLVSFLGTWTYRMDRATARAADALGPLAVGDPRWSGVYLARLEPDASEDAACCFEVHFPALDGEAPATWLHASAGWQADSATLFDPSFSLVDVDGQPVATEDYGTAAAPTDRVRFVLPEPSPMDGELARRVSLLREMATHPPPLPYQSYNTVVLAMSDFDGPDMLRIYLVPASTDPDVVLVSGWLVWNVAEDSRTLGEPVRYGGGPLVFSGRELDQQTRPMVLLSSASLRTPTEAHIFASWTHRLQILVSTEYGLWRVQLGDVELLEVW